jgi:hypothetical protein
MQPLSRGSLGSACCITCEQVKKLHFLVLSFAALLLTTALGGCFPEGEGKAELIQENPQMGASGGEKMDQTAPVGPASTSPGNPTTSAFPSTAPPVGAGNPIVGGPPTADSSVPTVQSQTSTP